MKRFLFALIAFLPAALMAQTPSDIWMFEIKERSVSGEPIKITDRSDAYDNQPNFGGDVLYYTSFIDGQMDIFGVNIANQHRVRVTATPESEYSPTPTPDGDHISVIMVEKDSSQRLWKYHLLERKREVVLMDLQPIGYHVWFTNYDLGAFVLGEPNHLYIANSFNGQSYALTDSIGRSLQPIPGEFGQFSFVKYARNGKMVIHRTNGKELEKLTELPEGTRDFSWLGNQYLVTGVGAKLMICDLENNTWTEWHDLSGLGVTNISRIAVNDDQSKIAVVIER